MGINECSKPASKSSWDSQDFGDVNMVFKMVHFHKSSRPQWVKGDHAMIGFDHGLPCYIKNTTLGPQIFVYLSPRVMF